MGLFLLPAEHSSDTKSDEKGHLFVGGPLFCYTICDLTHLPKTRSSITEDMGRRRVQVMVQTSEPECVDFG